MKKQTTGLLCLAAGLLVGAVSAAPIAASLAQANPGQIQAAASYGINVVQQEGIRVTVAEEAEAGSVVDVLVEAIAPSILEIKDLLIDNQLHASKEGNGRFKFVMPSHAVSLSVTYEAEQAPSYQIGHTVGSAINFYQLPEYAKAGDLVSFAITFAPNSGYTWNGDVSVYTVDASGEKVDDVEVTGIESIFFFTMPESAVFVDAGVEARSYLINKTYANYPNSDILNAFGEISLVEEDEETGEEVLVKLIDSSIYFTTGRAAFGSKIRVPLHDIPSYYVGGLRILETGEEIMLEEGKDYVEFNLPGFNVTIEPIAETRYYEIDVVNSEHVTIEVYHKTLDLDGNPLYYLDSGEKPLAEYKETLYVRAVSNDANFGVSKLHWTAYEEGRETPIFDRDLDLNYDGFYVFTSNGVMSSQTLTVTESAAFDLLNKMTADYEEDSHLSLTPMVQDGSELVMVDPEHQAFPNNKLYLNIESDDPHFGLKEITFRYTKAGDDGIYSDDVRSDAFGKYIVIPADAETITFIIKEQPYFIEEFVGEYIGKYISTYYQEMGNRDYFNEITPWGTALITNRSSLGIRSVSPAEAGADYGTFNFRKGDVVQYSQGSYYPPDSQDNLTIETEYIASYSGSFVVYTDSPRVAGDGVTSPVAPNNSNTIVVGVKKNNANTVVKFDTVVDGDSNRWYIVTSGVGTDVEATLLINNTTGEVFNNSSVSIEFAQGETIEDENAIYAVSFNGNVVLEIGKSGGQSVVLDGYQGIYQTGDEDKPLVLDGVGHAAYGELEATYQINGEGQVVFGAEIITPEAYEKYNYVATLDKEAGTALVEGEAQVYESALENLTVRVDDTDDYPFYYDEETEWWVCGNHNVHSSESWLYFDFATDGVVNFSYYASNERNWDYATIYYGGWSIYTSKGTVTDSGELLVPVTAGTTMTINYHKDGSGNTGEDLFRVGNINFYAAPVAGDQE